MDARTITEIEGEKGNIIRAWGKDFFSTLDNLRKACLKEPNETVNNKINVFIRQLTDTRPPQNLRDLLNAAIELEESTQSCFHLRHTIGQYTGTILGIILGTFLAVLPLLVAMMDPSAPLLIVAGAWMGWCGGKYVGQSLSYFFSPTIAKAHYATALREEIQSPTYSARLHGVR